jgi:hypothetical protein
VYPRQVTPWWDPKTNTTRVLGATIDLRFYHDDVKESTDHIVRRLLGDLETMDAAAKATTGTFEDAATIDAALRHARAYGNARREVAVLQHAAFDAGFTLAVALAEESYRRTVRPLPRAALRFADPPRPDDAGEHGGEIGVVDVPVPSLADMDRAHELIRRLGLDERMNSTAFATHGTSPKADELLELLKPLFSPQIQRQLEADRTGRAPHADRA